MKTEMIEAARLTREGRLSEATALIQRSLKSERDPMDFGAASSKVSTMDVIPSNASAVPALEPPPDSDAAIGNNPQVQIKTLKRAIDPSPGFGFPRLDLAALQKLDRRGVVNRVPGPGLSRRSFPPQVVAPSAGQWLAGAYDGQAGRGAYKLYVPSGDHGQSLPLVVMLHGCTQSADDFAAGTRMNFHGEAEGLLVVYPEQTAAANNSRCWNWFLPGNQQRGKGEPAVIAAITRQVMAEHRVDAGQVFIAGLSAGGAMAAIMAVTYPDLFAALGVHSGLAPGSAHDLPSALQAMQGRAHSGRSNPISHPIPLILFQGDHDATVHSRNSEEFIRQWAGPEEQLRVSRHGGQVAGGRAYSCTLYRDQSGQTFVERWTIHGASHAWAGGSPNGSFTDPAGPDASGELVRFFRAHPRQFPLASE